MATVDTHPKMPAVQEKEEEEQGLSLSHPVHSDRMRRWIVASYWIVFLLGLPVWWFMTSIERLPLPTGRIEELGGKEVKFPIRVEVDAGDVIPLEQLGAYGPKLERELARLAQQSPALWNSPEIEIALAGPERRAQFQEYSSHLCDPVDGRPSEDSYRVHLWNNLSTDVYMTCGRELFVRAEPSTTTSFSIAEKLRDLIVPYSNPALHSHAAESRIAQYSPTYRLAFTLLNEDASIGGAATGWEVQRALANYIQPTLSQLQGLHNFTVESQVQYFGGLTFDPEGPFVDEKGASIWTLSEEQLSVFVNSAEWTLTSGVSNDPVLHFILFIPSADRRPVHTFPSEDGSHTDAFIIPQWGGIVIYNPPTNQGDSTPNTFLSIGHLTPTFKLFRTQLRALLGVPQLPPYVSAHGQSAAITPWQLDALKRRRATENVQNSADALRSIVSLVNQIENMPVGQDVLGQVGGALAALDGTTATDDLDSLSQILSHSIDAFILSSKAFFNPGMIGLLYYPTEHKYAVYTPLFAPVAVPLVVGLLREIRAARERRKAGAGKRKTE